MSRSSPVSSIGPVDVSGLHSPVVTVRIDSPAPQPMTATEEHRLPTFWEVMCSRKDVQGVGNRSLFRGLVLGMLVMSLGMIAFGVSLGVWLRETVRTAASSSVDVEFDSLSFSVSQVVSDTLNSSVSILSVLGAAMSTSHVPHFAEFVLISNTIRQSLSQPIIQWAPLLNDTDRAAWEADVTQQLNDATPGLNMTFHIKTVRALPPF